jgi:hypothetical protein
MEVPHPFLETAMVGIHVVDVNVWRLWLWQARGGQDMELYCLLAVLHG